MKKRHLVLAILAVVLVLTSSIGAAVAYFTTFVTAKGGYAVHIANQSKIDEKYDSGKKTLSIQNTGESGKYPIFVRARAFAGEDYVLTPEVETGGKWNLSPSAPLDTNYWYYTEAVYGQESTTTMSIIIAYTDKNKEWKDGDERNIIVVYESTPAVFKADGTADLETAWTYDTVTVVNKGGNG